MLICAFIVRILQKRLSRDVAQVIKAPKYTLLRSVFMYIFTFRQFQNLPEEIWSRAAENLIELCFVACLLKQQK